ncbi:Hypothetical protein SCF082_LOCUS12040, partial [Durusdinium trenchii]
MASEVVFTATPEAFRAHQRKIKEAEQKEMAQKVAKARAARYNLTLRAKEMKKAKEAAEEHRRGSGRKSLARSLSKRLSSLSKRLSSASARRPGKGASTAASEAKAREDDEDGDEEDDTENDEGDDDEDDGEVVLWMGELARALEDQQENDINKAILTAFLSEAAPERVEEVDEMLEEYAGNEEELFDSLAKEHPVSKEDEEMLEAETRQALDEAIPDDASDYDEEDGGEYILSLTGDNFGKWAANVQGHMLKQRMLKGGATEEDVDAIMANQKQRKLLERAETLTNQESLAERLGAGLGESPGRTELAEMGQLGAAQPSAPPAVNDAAWAAAAPAGAALA